MKNLFEEGANLEELRKLGITTRDGITIQDAILKGGLRNMRQLVKFIGITSKHRKVNAELIEKIKVIFDAKGNVIGDARDDDAKELDDYVEIKDKEIEEDEAPETKCELREELEKEIAEEFAPKEIEVKLPPRKETTEDIKQKQMNMVLELVKENMSILKQLIKHFE